MNNKKDWDLYNKIKKEGKISVEQEERILSELNFQGDHSIKNTPSLERLTFKELTKYMVKTRGIYTFNDMNLLQGINYPKPDAIHALQTLDELMERDNQREKDGFPKKIKVGKIVKPGKGKKGKVIVVPITQEEKFYHDDTFTPSAEGGQGEGGQGEGEEGEVIKEVPADGDGNGGQGDGEAGEGDGGEHEIGSDAYDLGKVLTKQFELPNIQEKTKKRAVTRYTYDLTDRNRHGQILDKKETLKKIVETNLVLGNIPDISNINPQKFLIAPRDRVMKALSREQEYESPAAVFFLRDYSGSMHGKPTEVVVNQHVMIYSWLMYQYDKIVDPRFILHDTVAKEVPDFYTYYNSAIAGGTKIKSAFAKVNEIVEKENLAKDYNIYVFYGGDGDDWDEDGQATILELEKILKYVNRIGITIVSTYFGASMNLFENYLGQSGILQKHPDLIRMDTMGVQEADEDRLIEGIKRLIEP